MRKEVNISAGEIFTLSLLKKIDKKAYSSGGLRTEGGIRKKTALNPNAKTTVLLKREYILVKDIDKFLASFQKTMNSAYYNIKIIYHE